jgi:hypothetical protein
MHGSTVRGLLQARNGARGSRIGGKPLRTGHRRWLAADEFVNSSSAPVSCVMNRSSSRATSSRPTLRARVSWPDDRSLRARVLRRRETVQGAAPAVRGRRGAPQRGAGRVMGGSQPVRQLRSRAQPGNRDAESRAGGGGRARQSPAGSGRAQECVLSRRCSRSSGGPTRYPDATTTDGTTRGTARRSWARFPEHLIQRFA